VTRTLARERTFQVLPLALEAASGARELLPMLVERETWLPPRMALRWTVRKRRWECMPATLDKDQRALALLYRWADRNLDVDLDDLLEAGGFLIGGQIDSLVTFLRTRVADAETQRINADATPTLATLGTVARPVRSFLDWAADPQARGGLGVVDPTLLAHYRARLVTLFEPAVRQHSDSDRIRPLSLDEDERLRTFVAPIRDSDGRPLLPLRFHEHNPFAPETRLRNWLMIDTAREAGFRRGEILVLRIDDVASAPYPYLGVRRRPNSSADIRRRPPQVKRGERDVPIPSLVWNGLRAYQTTARPYGRRGARTPYLFIATNHGGPLSLSAADDLIGVAARAADISDLSWHTLRHTWAEEVAEELLEQHDGDEEAALGVLRTLGGWSAKSETPRHYIRNTLARNAREFQRQRVSALWRVPTRGGTE
jgi:integrase